ncbi:MAG: glycosyltransferase [Planctomycetes bacterium]|nr:glycosyltransferase [Planctomycetota bacterium]
MNASPEPLGGPGRLRKGMKEAGKKRERPLLLFIITRMIAGGAQKVVLDLIDNLNPDEFEVHLASGLETGREGSLWKQLRERLPQERIHELPALVRDVNPLKEISAYFQIRRLLDTLKPDIVHTHTSKAGVLGRLASVRAGVPCIVHSTHVLIYEEQAQIPGVSGRGLLRRFFMALDRFCSHRTHMNITLSEEEVGQHLRLGLCRQRQLCCIPNGIPLKAYAAIERKFSSPPFTNFRLGTAGRLNREKGHSLLIAMLHRLLPRYPFLSLDIAGSGPMEQELRELSKRLKVDGRVHFRGYVEDMVGYLSGIDLFVLGSHYEGFGLVLVEAMAASLPVVATDVGGVKEVVEDGVCGLIAPSGMDVELALSVEYFLENPHLLALFGQRGRKRALERFSLEHMVETHRRIYLAAGLKKTPPAVFHEVDLHVHTRHSFDSKADVAAVLRRAQKAGLKAIAITDHDSLEGVLEARRLAPAGLLVISGVEVRTDNGDLIGLFVEEPIRSRVFAEVVAEIRAQGGVVLLPHPFRSRKSMHCELPPQVDVFEVCNGRAIGPRSKDNAFSDRDTVNFVASYGKTGIGASDAHCCGEVGSVRTCLPPFEGAEELKKLLLSGRIFPVKNGSAWVPETLDGDYPERE